MVTANFIKLSRGLHIEYANYLRSSILLYFELRSYMYVYTLLFFHCRQLPRINNFRRVEPTTATFPPYQQPLERNISQPNRSPAIMYGYDNIQQEQPSHIPYVLYVVKIGHVKIFSECYLPFIGNSQ